MKNKKEIIDKNKIIDYFSGFLLPPWIWLWGFWIIITGFLFYFQYSGQKEIVQFLAFDYFSEIINLYNIWAFTSVTLLLNYTLSFLLKKGYPKLPFFFFILSLLNLSFLTMLLFPHFVILLSR
jgi:hypothetical protein